MTDSKECHLVGYHTDRAIAYYQVLLHILCTQNTVNDQNPEILTLRYNVVNWFQLFILTSVKNKVHLKFKFKFGSKLMSNSLSNLGEQTTCLN